MSEQDRLYKIWCKATEEANEAISRRDQARYNLDDAMRRETLKK